MVIKKQILPATAILAIMISPPSQAWDVQINVNGNIVDTTCDVKTSSFSVLMGDQPISELKSSIGSVSPLVPFTIDLVNCSKMASGVNIVFSGTGSTDVSLLKVDNNGATGIGIELLDEDKNQIAINDTSKNYTLIPSVDNTLQFYARYKTDSFPVAAGDANATATFTLTYL